MSRNPLPLYHDMEGKRPVPYSEVDGRIVYESMSFTPLDGGMEASSDFYIRNMTMGVVADFTVEVESVNKEDIKVTLMSESSVPRLAAQEIYHGSLRWTAKEGVKAGQCIAQISVEGMLTQE